MRKGPYPPWALLLRDSVAAACVEAGFHDDEAATIALEAIVTGALSGSVGRLGKRACYAATQPLVDILAEWIADEDVDNAAKTKGKQK
jgi:hypothetical protein